jgi:hypothetical protein
MIKQAAIYGAVVNAALFFVGWITGFGGSFWPNLGFSLLMGVFAAVCFVLAHRFAKAKGRQE